MKVVDLDKSEISPQRRLAKNGRRLHCCCICGALDVWGSNWSVYCSVRDLDDGLPTPKFCSEPCKIRGGINARNVTEAMKQIANDAEWREPALVYRDATPIEKYRDAVQKQRSQERPK